jgi:endonuclease YncB( thermonuclease family)
MELLKLILMLAAVVGVADGETVQVKNDANQTITVQLACIDVPQRIPHSQSIVATQRLKELLPSGIPITIRSVEEHKNSRLFGEVFVGNRSVNLQMVEEGKAIVDRKTLDHCPENEEKFVIAETNAKKKKIGIWQQPKSSNTNSQIFNPTINQIINPTVNPKQEVLRGKLVYQKISHVMSMSAYRGEEYILITDSSKLNRLVLRPSSKVSANKLKLFNNQQVEIKAVYIQGNRPSTNQTACPLEADGQCMRQGEGYQVLSIEPLFPKK